MTHPLDPRVRPALRPACRTVYSLASCLALTAFFGSLAAAPAQAGSPRSSGRIVLQLTNPKTGVVTLATVRPNGSHLRRIRLTQQAEAPSWSANGRWIAFDDGGPANTPDGHVHLFIVRPSGRGLRQITRGAGDQGFPTWSPDGRYLAFDGNWPDKSSAGYHAGIGTVNRRTGAVREITKNPFGTCDTCFDGTPAWSPNGRLIAFTRSGSTGAAVYTVRPNGRRLHRLTAYDLDAAHSTWSPDSRRIAFDTNDDGLNPSIAGDIDVVSTHGGPVRNLTHNKRGIRYSFQPTWSPSGRHIAYVDYRKGDSTTHLYTMKPNGSQPHVVPIEGPFPALPDWGL